MKGERYRVQKARPGRSTPPPAGNRDTAQVSNQENFEILCRQLRMALDLKAVNVVCGCEPSISDPAAIVQRYFSLRDNFGNGLWVGFTSDGRIYKSGAVINGTRCEFPIPVTGWAE